MCRDLPGSLLRSNGPPRCRSLPGFAGIVRVVGEPHIGREDGNVVSITAVECVASEFGDQIQVDVEDSEGRRLRAWMKPTLNPRPEGDPPAFVQFISVDGTTPVAVRVKDSPIQVRDGGGKVWPLARSVFDTKIKIRVDRNSSGQLRVIAWERVG